MKIFKDFKNLIVKFLSWLHDPENSKSFGDRGYFTAEEVNTILNDFEKMSFAKQKKVLYFTKLMNKIYIVSIIIISIFILTAYVI